MQLRRSEKKVAFVAHCLVNQNAKVAESARCRGVVTPVVDCLRRHGYQLQQLPCPEMTFLGVNRWWQTKEQYDTLGYRRHCRTLARITADSIEQFQRRDYEMVIVGLDGSPSSGVRFTGTARGRWGGRPESSEDDFQMVAGMGVWMEELKAELERRGIPFPRATGIPAYSDENGHRIRSKADRNPADSGHPIRAKADGLRRARDARLFDCSVTITGFLPPLAGEVF